jgi:hypothetical protein
MLTLTWQNAKRPAVAVDGAVAEVKFGKDVVKLDFDDSVDATPSVSVTPHNVVVSFKKAKEGVWESLPGRDLHA